MANALHDANNVSTMLGVTAGGVITQIKVDDTTGYLLASIAAPTGSPSFTRLNAAHDDNNVASMTGVDPDGNARAVAIENATGYLLGTLS